MLVFAGVAVGIAGAMATGRLLNAILFQTQGTDPLSTVLTILTLSTIGIAAAWIPARRAANVDPAEALRAE